MTANRKQPMTAPKTEYRDGTLHGRGAIVLRIVNHYGFREHGTVEEAKAEAARLAEKEGGEFVVYVPIASVVRAPKTITTDIARVVPVGQTKAASRGWCGCGECFPSETPSGWNHDDLY